MTMNWNQHHPDHFRNARVLVTGAAGFIGSHITEALVSLGAQVVAIDDLSGGSWANLAGFNDTSGGVTQITGSIADEKAVAQAVAGCRYVFHLAGLGSVPRSVAEPQRYMTANVMGTYQLLQAAKTAGVQRVIFSGSSNYYGDIGGEAAKVESQPPMPLSPYAATKLFCEGAMRSWAYSFGMDTVVLRYFNIFGPRQNPDSAYAAVIAAFAKAMLKRQPPVIFGSGEQSRDFTFVHNAVHANLLAARFPGALMGEAFNVACGHGISVNELCAAMAKLLNCTDIAPIHQPGRAGEILHSKADITKARSTLGYQPLVDFDTGLAATVQWYRQHLS